MLAAVIILILTFFIVFFVSNYKTEPTEDDIDAIRKDPQLNKLWRLAQSAMKERKPLKAEKALLTILKFDEKNAAAYNRLGILYAKEKHFKEAIECFEIAQSLDNNASSLHNVGLIYYETGKYEKAAMAFSQAIDIEGDQPARYIAYAKALEKLGERFKAADALETAYSLSPSTVVLRHLLELYEHNEDIENIENTKRRIEDLKTIKEDAEKQKQKQKQKRALIARNQKATKAQKNNAHGPLMRRKTSSSVTTPANKARTQIPHTAKHPTTTTPAKKIAKKRKII